MTRRPLRALVGRALGRALGLAFAVALAGAACTTPGPAEPPTPTETATASATPTAVPITAALACPPGELPATPRAGEARDAWARARSMLPTGIEIYRPASVPARFGPPALLAACLEPDDIPQLTVVYRAGDGGSGEAGVGAEYLAFLINGGHSTYGNTPGPATSTERLTVRGVEGTLMTVAGATREQPTVRVISWREGISVHQVKASSTVLTADELRAIVEGLVRVP